jgi:cellulose 1,4-beta-cellobiosidase
MKKQNALSKGIRFTLLIVAFLGVTLATYGQVLGDVNNNSGVTIVDALMIAQYTVGLNPSGFITSVADVNCDSNITIVDALVVAQYTVGLVSLPASCGGSTTTSTRTATRTATTPVVTTPPTGTGTATHIAGNPWSGASWYVNHQWTNLFSSPASLKNVNTCVWMDRIGAITQDGGLAGHLDACLSQGQNLIFISVYDLPNRDCAAYASNGELTIAGGGAARYKAEFIDPIAAIESNAKYQGIRIVNMIEIDSLPNLVTNTSVAKCQEAAGAGGYVECIQYCLNKLAVIPNVYNYVDIAHSGWLGWDSNLQPAVNVIANCVKGTSRGINSVDGFISNTCNYTPWEEPFITDPNASIGGTQIKAGSFYEYNPYVDEKRFVQAMYNAFVSAGFNNSIGMLHDTSRNGWGGSSYGRSRPTAASTATEVNAWVNATKIDRRYHRGNWCNQAGGIGVRPTTSTGQSFMDAFVWAKPPGESDGISQAGVTDPNDPAKTFDIQCDPNGMSRYNGNFSTGAVTAPHAGRWNQAHFDQLVANAYPAL